MKKKGGPQDWGCGFRLLLLLVALGSIFMMATYVLATNDKYQPALWLISLACVPVGAVLSLMFAPQVPKREATIVSKRDDLRFWVMLVCVVAAISVFERIQAEVKAPVMGFLAGFMFIAASQWGLVGPAFRSRPEPPPPAGS